MILATGATWGICAAATAGVIARPFRWLVGVQALDGIGAAGFVLYLLAMPETKKAR